MRRVYVTGGHGFLGRHVCAAFRSSGWAVEAPTSKEVDCRLPFSVTKNDVLVHCAARVGGIGANRMRPAMFFADNMRMGLCALDAATIAKIPLLMVGTTCSYPGDLEPPFGEESLWAGYPERTNAPYGVAKRALVTAAEAYRAEFSLSVTTLILANLYGPGDSANLLLSHVVPAVIAKVQYAIRHSEKSIRLWGDGTPTRDFLYVEDAARAIVLAATGLVTEPTFGGGPFNVGTGVETSIRELATKIVALCGAGNLEIVWEAHEPNGQQRRALNSGYFQSHTRWRPTVSLDEGLRRMLATEDS